MERIASFQVDHKKLNRGIYVSRLDEINGNYITTFDIRMKLPNREPVINIAELHTIEHLGATFLRNHPTRKDEIIYFGPMGCRTGFYLILKGKLESKNIVELIKEMFDFIEKHGIKPKIVKIFTLDEISLAHKFLESNSANGKVIITTGQ